MINQKDLVLLFGATGKTGFHIANALIDNGYAVRVVVRSKSKITQLFKQKQISFQKIIEGDLKNDDTLKQAFQPSSTFGRVKYAISSIGYATGSKESVEDVQYTYQVKIMEKSKEAKVDKFIFVTAMLMERPWHLIAALLNSFVPNVYHWKAKAQNHLRRSGLNYAIVRPPGLVGSYEDTKITSYKIDQGDKINGRITRCTLGRVILQTVQSRQIPSKVTFECAEATTQTTQENFKNLKPDTEKNIVNVNHKTPKFVYGTVLLSSIALGSYFAISHILGR